MNKCSAYSKHPYQNVPMHRLPVLYAFLPIVLVIALILTLLLRTTSCGAQMGIDTEATIS